MRLLFAGTPDTAVPSLQALLESQHEVVAVLTRPDAPAGRGGKMSSSAVKKAAVDHGLDVLQPASIRGDEFAAQLRSLDIDAVAVVAYGALIPESLLAMPRHGWINLHFSLLPAWRGAAPVPAAIKAGDDVTGASTFLIEKDLDTGPVYGTVTETIHAADTAGDLLARLADSGAQLLVATIDGLADGTLTAVPQSGDGVSYVGKISTDAAKVDFAQPAVAVDRLIRSVTPDPGAWTDSRWGRLGLGPVQPIAQDGPSLAPGEIGAGKREVVVGTASGPVRLGTVKPPGKRDMPAADWARGARPEPGERLGTSGSAGHRADSSAANAINSAGTNSAASNNLEEQR